MVGVKHRSVLGLTTLLTLASGNVTSLWNVWQRITHADRLCQVSGPAPAIWMLQETAVFGPRLKPLRALLAAKGWKSLLSSQPQASNGKPIAGVGSLFRSSIRLVAVQPPEELQKFAEEGRLLIARLLSQDGSLVAFLVTVYGYAKACDKTQRSEGGLSPSEALVSGILQFATATKAPVIIGGDLNCCRENSLSLHYALASGNIIGLDPSDLPTCQSHLCPGATPSNIDHL